VNPAGPIGDQPFHGILLAICAVIFPILLYHRVQSQKTREKLDRRQEGLLVFLTLRPIGGALLAGLFLYLADPRTMAWSALHLSAPLRWVGIALALAGATLLFATLRSLGKNLTDTVVTRREHTLVTRGPYRWVRHPFYVSVALFVEGVSLAAASWFFLASGAVVLTLIGIRTRTEEAKLEERFGEDYRAYKRQTGMFVPRFGGSR
jgi:protein-S-isoprenylcysteine O-methyltransferase Ste14